MNPDKALKKALTRKVSDLTYGFHNKVMDQVLLEAKRENRQNYFWSLCLVALVSIFMVAGTIYVLYQYASFNFFAFLSGIKFPGLSDTTFDFYFYFYISFLILILLGLDIFIRKWKHKTK